MAIYYCESYPEEHYREQAKEILGNPNLPFRMPVPEEEVVEAIEKMKAHAAERAKSIRSVYTKPSRFLDGE